MDAAIRQDAKPQPTDELQARRWMAWQLSWERTLDVLRHADSEHETPRAA